jgi:MFS transporter, AAHS family, 4-hydroxybenzoate transporter
LSTATGTLAPTSAAAPAARVVLLCFLVNAFDGFDIQAIAYTAPVLRTHWSLDARMLGLAFSSALVGMALGSVLLGPLSDRIGRRRTVLGCVLLFGTATALTGFARAPVELLALRALTGFGIGGVLPSLSTLVAECAPARHRNLLVALMHLGYPVGATLGGLLAAVLIPGGGWRAVFWAGGGATLALLPLLYFGLPESPAFQAARAAGGAPRRGAAIAQTFGMLRLAAPPLHTLALCTAFFMGYLALYFLMSWTPTLLVDSGLRLEQSIYAGIALNAGGGIGMLALGEWSARRGLRRLIAVFFVIAGAGMALMGQLVGALAPLLVLTVMVGFFGLGALIGLYSVAARLYPAEVRAGATGIAIGAGRIGGIVGPVLGGALLALHWPMGHYFALLALPLLLAGLAVAALRAGALERPATGAP